VEAPVFQDQLFVQAIAPTLGGLPLQALTPTPPQQALQPPSGRGMGTKNHPQRPRRAQQGLGRRRALGTRGPQSGAPCRRASRHPPQAAGVVARPDPSIPDHGRRRPTLCRVAARRDHRHAPRRAARPSLDRRRPRQRRCTGRTSKSAGRQSGGGWRAETARGRRTIALDPATIAALRQHRKRLAEERLLAGPSYVDSGLVFTMPDGSPIHPNRFSLWFRTRARAANLPTIRLHDMRHSYATAGLAAGVPPKVMSERLGRHHGVHARHLHQRAARAGQVCRRGRRRPYPWHRCEQTVSIEGASGP
jgi:hypothetical protein